MPQISWDPTLLCSSQNCTNYLSGLAVEENKIQEERIRLIHEAATKDWAIESGAAICPDCMKIALKDGFEVY